MASTQAAKAMHESDRPRQYATPVERIYFEWDKALSSNDAKALTDLYAEDAVLESPLIPHLLGKQDGVCRGRQEIRSLLDHVAARKPSVRRYHRTGYLTDGKRLIWEYPRSGPEGDQMDL